MTNDLKVLHLRVPAELRDRVAEFAQRTRRSLNSAAIVLLEQALEGQDATRGEP